MEVGVASYSQGRAVSRASPDPGASARGSPRSSPRAGAMPRGESTPPRGQLHVEFAQVGEVKERKEKYLTAKYGAHQMSLIRKRLAVEMWMFDRLQTLYQNHKGETVQEKEMDLDELMDIEDDPARRKFLQKQLSDCKRPAEVVEDFIEEVLQRAKTL